MSTVKPKIDWETQTVRIFTTTVSIRQIAGFTPWKWERLPQALHTAPERCSILEADPVHVNVFHVIVAVRSVIRLTEEPRSKLNFNCYHGFCCDNQGRGM